jgi:hypothetical protein
MENLSKIIGSIGWPHIALIFGLIFMFKFQKQIREFIGRIKSVGKGGVTTESSPEIQKEDQRQKAVEELMNIGDSIVIRELEQLIKADLKKRGLESEGDSINILSRHLAATQLVLDFEQIHSLIFGSQIYLLKKLNEVAGQGKSKEFINNYFSQVKDMFNELREWTVEQYLDFLRSRALITFQDGNYHITNKGVEYLTWMIRTGHSEDRVL